MEKPLRLQSDAGRQQALLMHRALRRADIQADLHIFDAATHVMFMTGPEAADRMREVRKFVDRHWSVEGYGDS